MNQAKNRLTVILMLSSISLLLVLQAFWLVKVFEDAKRDLRKDVSIAFEKTIFSMQDSLIQANIRSVPGNDSLPAFFTRKIIMKDSMMRKNPHADSSVKFFATDDIGSKIEILLSGTPLGDDSLRRIMRPMITRINKDSNHRNFILRLGMDSLRIADIHRNFSMALHQAGIMLPFKVKRILGSGAGFTSEGVSLLSDPASISPVDSYISYFDHLQPYLLSRIKIEILFSFFLTLVTVTAFVIMYRNLQAQQRLMVLKNDFISNVTHELKTPIATVSVALEALQNFKGIENPQLTREYLDIAQQELGRLALLTDKVLTTSLFDERGIRIEIESVDLQKVIDGILSSMKLLFDKQGANVEFKKTGSDFVFHGSAVHFTNVVHNLLDNALKYSPTSPHIVLHLNDLGEKLKLSVQDNGLGIPEEYHKKIFEKFFRMPTGDTHNIKGHGLGLSYVESVVKAHKGRIEVKSEMGKGSTFLITVPK